MPTNLATVTAIFLLVVAVLTTARARPLNDMNVEEILDVVEEDHDRQLRSLDDDKQEEDLIEEDLDRQLRSLVDNDLEEDVIEEDHDRQLRSLVDNDLEEDV